MTGSSTRSRGARGSSSPCRTCRSPIDSRIEVFPAEVWDDYGAVTGGEVGWEAILDRWGVTIVVAPADQDAYIARLRAAGWVEQFADEDAVVFTVDAR